MKTKQGISLIVLVITIIVMIILAGAIILSLNNSGIINNASDAVEKSDESQIRNMVQVYWAEAYAESDTRTKNDLQERLAQKIANSKLDVSEYGIVVTTSGVEIVKGWVQDGLYILKGNYALEEAKRQEVEIGSYIEYTEIGAEYSGKWQVLGASDTGELLILSNKAIATVEMILDSYPTDEIAKLNSACESYGKGTGATGARSINIEDINKITGYDPEKEANTLSGYGITTTYTRIGESYDYEFVYPDGNTYILNGAGGVLYCNEKECKDTPEKFTLTNNFYTYNPYELTNVNTNSEAYLMLFESECVNYGLDSMFVDSIEYGVRTVRNKSVSGSDLATVDNWLIAGNNFSTDVRAVVSLEPSVNLVSITGGWAY